MVALISTQIRYIFALSLFIRWRYFSLAITVVLELLFHEPQSQKKNFFQMQGKFSKYTPMVWSKDTMEKTSLNYANFNMGSGLNFIHHITPITSSQISVSEYTGFNISSHIVFHNLWKVWSFTPPPPHFFRNSQKYFSEKLKGRCTVLTYVAITQSFLKGNHPYYFTAASTSCSQV